MKLEDTETTSPLTTCDRYPCLLELWMCILTAWQQSPWQPGMDKCLKSRCLTCCLDNCPSEGQHRLISLLEIGRHKNIQRNDFLQTNRSKCHSQIMDEQKTGVLHSNSKKMYQGKFWLLMLSIIYICVCPLVTAMCPVFRANPPGMYSILSMHHCVY